MPVTDVDAQREQFHRELMRKSMRIAELELLLEQTRAQYEESLSWRLTKPVRMAGRVRDRLRAAKPGG